MSHSHGTQITGGGLTVLQENMQDFMVRGPPWGSFPDPTKIIWVVSPRNVMRAEAYLRGMVAHVVTGSRYLGGFIGNLAADKACITEEVTGWDDSV